MQIGSIIKKSKELKKKNDELKALSSERDNALKTLAAEQIVINALRKTEVNRLKVLKEKNAQLELLAIQRDNVMEELRKDKDEIFNDFIKETKVLIEYSYFSLLKILSFD